MTGEIEHGWVTADSPDASEVNAGNLNDHVIDATALAALIEPELTPSAPPAVLAAARIYVQQNFR